MSYDPIRDFDSLWARTPKEFRYDLIHEWYEERKQGDVVKLAKHMWRARRNGGAVYDVSLKDWYRLCERYRWCCAYCGEKRPLSLEHVVPVSRGGRHVIGNILPACEKCNGDKNNKLISEWRRHKWRRKRRLTAALASSTVEASVPNTTQEQHGHQQDQVTT